MFICRWCMGAWDYSKMSGIHNQCFKYEKFVQAVAAEVIAKSFRNRR